MGGLLQPMRDAFRNYPIAGTLGEKRSRTVFNALLGIFENKCAGGIIDSLNSNMPRITRVHVYIRRKCGSNGNDFDASEK